MKILGLLLFLPILASPVFAAGNLSVNSTNLALAYINTRALTNMLNLSLNSTGGDTNLTGINVTIGGTASIGNVTLVALVNSTGSVIASNTTNSSSTGFTIFIAGGFNVSGTTLKNLIVALNTSSSAATLVTVNISLSPSASFFVDSGSNATVLAGFINSSSSQIQDVRANASITPNIVDTFVVNQSFTYIFTPTGANAIQNFNVGLPSSFTLVNITAVEQGGSNLSSALYTNATQSSQVNVTLNTPINAIVKIFFTANTSSDTTGNFSSVIAGSNLTNVATEIATGNRTNVTAKQLVNVTNVGAMKTVAILNDTDYWEFNFTINITDTVTGLLQLKMNNWTSNQPAGSIVLFNSTEHFATFRTSSNFSATSRVNVTNEYNITSGLSISASPASPVIVFLRMLIPRNTVISSSWYTTYSMIFRSS